MMEKQATRTGAAASRVDNLLGLLSVLSQDDPPRALRGRLEVLSSRRLRREVESGVLARRPRTGFLLRFEAVLAVAVLITIGMAAVFAAHFRRPATLQPKIESRVIPPSAPLDPGLGAPPPAASPESTLPAARHSLRTLIQDNPSQRMTVRLPYSDAAIDTGTDATIRVSMSQAELASLGFPMNTTLYDRRVLAEVTLGDDGLPRAISVSLPLEVLKEKK
jgi:hypothetical protein